MVNSSTKEFIPLSEPFIGKKEEEAAIKCLRSGFVSSSGPVVSEFEEQFAAAVGTRYAVATVSGTAAIHVALKTLNISQGDSVFVPDLTFVASMNPVLYCGAKPVLLDVESKSWCLDPQILEMRCIEMIRTGNRPFAVIPVHLYGCACDMNRIMTIAAKYKLHVIEDATEALGTRLNQKQIGTFGHMGCFSFNQNKLMTTGSGGMIVTDNEFFAKRARYLVNQARDSADNYIHSEAGFNYRMNSISAAIGIAQLEQIDEFIGRKREIATLYKQAFQGIESIQLHPEREGVLNSFWLFSMVMENNNRRDSMIQALKADGIQAHGFFAPLHSQPYIKDKVWIDSNAKTKASEIGISDRLSACGLNLPSSTGMTKSQQNRVISSFLAHCETSLLKYTHTSQKEIQIQKTA